MIAHSSIKNIIENNPEVTGVFERYHIDYWANGNMSLSEVMKEDVQQLFDIVREIHLMHVRDRVMGNGVKPTEMSLRDLCGYIVEKHHTFIKSTLPAILVHGFQVAQQFSHRMPQLEEVKVVLTKIRAEFTHHMMKEEEILFPGIIMLEDALLKRSDASISIKMIVDPVKSILNDHSHADAWFSQIRSLTNNFLCPSFADNLFRQFFQELRDFEADLHLHVYLENEVLLPKVKNLIIKYSY